MVSPSLEKHGLRHPQTQRHGGNRRILASLGLSQKRDCQKRDGGEKLGDRDRQKNRDTIQGDKVERHNAASAADVGHPVIEK